MFIFYFEFQVIKFELNLFKLCLCTRFLLAHSCVNAYILAGKPGQYERHSVSNENQCIRLKKIFTVYISLKCTEHMSLLRTWCHCNLWCHILLNGDDLQLQCKQPRILHCHA